MQSNVTREAKATLQNSSTSFGEASSARCSNISQGHVLKMLERCHGSKQIIVCWHVALSGRQVTSAHSSTQRWMISTVPKAPVGRAGAGR